jgi:hypothetical protein
MKLIRGLLFAAIVAAGAFSGSANAVEVTQPLAPTASPMRPDPPTNREVCVQECTKARQACEAQQGPSCYDQFLVCVDNCNGTID